jgi:carbamoyl-phosphate synthase large subunit
MKAVGEVMSIGRTFPEAMNKAWQSLEIGRSGLGADGYSNPDRKEVRQRLLKPYWDRTLQIRNAFKLGATVEEIADITKVDPWFLQQIRYMVSLENHIEGLSLDTITREDLLEVKRAGFSDVQIAWLLSKAGEKVNEKEVRSKRLELGLKQALNWWTLAQPNFRLKPPTTTLPTKVKMRVW